MSIMLIQMLPTIMGLNTQRVLAKHPTKMVTPKLLCAIILLYNPMSSSSFIVHNGISHRQKRLLFSPRPRQKE